MREIVFEVLAEGGGLRIERVRDENGEKFFYHHEEFDFDDGDLGISKGGEYETFEDPFQLINTKFDYWFQLHVETVREEYRGYVTDEVIKSLNHQGRKPEDLEHSHDQLEKVLGIKLEYGHLPIDSDLQNIVIEVYTGTSVVYEYADYSERYYYHETENVDILKIQRKEESLTSEVIRCKGKIQVSGSTIIIKNEHDQPTHIFNSEKAFVTTSPILGNSKGWYYTSL